MVADADCKLCTRESVFCWARWIFCSPTRIGGCCGLNREAVRSTPGGVSRVALWWSNIRSTVRWQKNRQLYHKEAFVVQSLSCVWIFVTPWTSALQASRSFTISQSLLRFMSFESMMPSNYLILCCSLLLSSVLPIIRVFSNKSDLCIRWPKYWSFSFGISPSNEYSGLISFRINWFDFPGVQGTLKSILQHHNSKVCVCVLLVQSCPTLCNCINCSPPGSSVRGIF